jgi:hypothetical protein
MSTAGRPGAEWLDALRGAPDAYLATARALWQAAAAAAAEADPARRAQAFAAQLQALQPQLAAAFAANGPGFGALATGVGDLPGLAAAAAGAAPALGPGRERLLAWQRLQQLQAQATLQHAQLAAIWGGVIAEALRELATVLGTPPFAPDPSASSPRALYDAWIDCAERAFASAAHQPAFAHAQAALINTQAELRLRQRDLLEDWARQFDLPTRAELDSVHRRLRELQAEVRTLRAAAPAAGRGARRRRTPRRAPT